MKKFEYNFPACSQYEGTLLQVVKIIEEANEVLDAYVHPRTRSGMFIEVMDVIQACETLLRAFGDDGVGLDIQDFYEAAVEKNRVRGYYG